MKEANALRSRTMRAVKGKDTAPELIVRHLAHSLGYRYRLHRSDLAGKPDLVFPGRQKIIFVHGCFWHGHSCVRGDRQPKTNAAYWRTKITRNKTRDQAHLVTLAARGWRSLVIWECELKQVDRVREQLAAFLEGTTMTNSTNLKAPVRLSRNREATLEQDTAAGGAERRKLRTKTGEVVTVSLAVAASGSALRVILRFKWGGSTVQRLVGTVTAVSRIEALKLGWKMTREKKIVESQGWSWVVPSP